MPYARENSLRGDRRRHRLLELGLELFGTRSYADISIDDIAAKAGISRGLLYHYFSNKRGFYVESIRFAAAQLLDRVSPGRDLSPDERLREGLTNYLLYVENFGTAYATFMRSGLGFDPTVAEIVERTRETIVNRILDDMGFVDPPTLFRVAVRSWIGMVETASMDWLEEREPMRQDLIDLLAAGLRAVIESAAALTYGERERWPATLR